MMRAVSLLIAIVGLSAGAVVPVVPADSLGIPQSMRLHWRVRPAAAGDCRVGIVWNYTDTANYDLAQLVLADSRHTDAFGRESAVLELLSVRDGVVAESSACDFSPAENVAAVGISLLLELEEGASRPMLHAGVRQADISLPVEIRPLTRAGVFAATPVDTLLRQLQTVQKPAPEYAPFADVAALREYLQESADVSECEWVYHDRDTDPLRVSLGGDYRLATVRHPDGGYMLVYLSGRADWQPLRIKGRLRPTGFIGEYDLDWTDAEGMPMGTDCSALMTGASMLTFRFPLHDATLRFRRATNL